MIQELTIFFMKDIDTPIQPIRPLYLLQVGSKYVHTVYVCSIAKGLMILQL